jgi:hypothetical protein
MNPTNQEIQLYTLIRSMIRNKERYDINPLVLNALNVILQWLDKKHPESFYPNK